MSLSVGGASVFKALIESGIPVKEYVLSDINGDLMDLYRTIRENPAELCRHYDLLWAELNKDNDLERKKRFFSEIRERYNREKDPMDFMFIMRTTTNGMPRYNRNGEFNNSFHVTRNGIMPKKLEQTVLSWSRMLEKAELRTCNYADIAPSPGDFVYLDPPYANTKGMYYGAIEYPPLWEYLQALPCGWALSFDGIAVEDNTQNVPKIYDEHIYLKSGNSSFRRVIGKNNNVTVYESLYVKR